MKITALATGIFASLLFMSPLSLANDPVAERETRMKNIDDINRKLDMMVKGHTDFDLVLFKSGVVDMQTAMVGMLDLFPPGSGGGETSAKEKIWDHWDDYIKRHQAMVDGLANLSQAVTSGDEDDIEDSHKAFKKTCKSCHRKYRTKKW